MDSTGKKGMTVDASATQTRARDSATHVADAARRCVAAIAVPVMGAFNGRADSTIFVK